MEQHLIYGRTCNTISRRNFSLALITSLASLYVPSVMAKNNDVEVDLNEETISLPALIRGKVYQLETTLFRPDTTNRHPLVVINHGTSENTDKNRERARFISASRALVGQGFAVAVPMRRGYGNSEGGQVRLEGADLTDYGLENALDIHGAISYLKSQDYVDPQRMVVIGQSTGGLSTMAYLSMADQGVLGGLNFHGGVRPHNLNSDPKLDARITAFTTYAKSTRIPSMWFYTENDHSSHPEFIVRLHDAYQQAGGNATLVQLPAFGEDGHYLFSREEGLGIWWPKASTFLSALIGTPNQV
ncbi:dienelactone hydrolase [Herbaspirillum sp. Sphag1AN]|uniref:dienelactone hydrolase family protein n=1 Tax=unclassified Herbaspirillum TaxID=2624150 RepID=UPI00161B1C69|nr:MULTISPECIES: alpha/beta fold hydrolase [unclassified Herbaspirillum]MBB3210853.1 dienelactone hydrolase [Herbaspirillum sp. Sphag1AN]MBB3244483.1 dienelactone hydrolase [Herbaspirillum sp. Sphag64]